jgi:hypothetical protein
MMESLEGRQLFSVSLTPAAPSPTPVPYPTTTTADSGKVKTSDIVIVKTTDPASANLM